MCEMYPKFVALRKGTGTDEERAFPRHSIKYFMLFVNALRTVEPGSREHSRLLSLAFSFQVGSCFLDFMAGEEEFSYDAGFGSEGSLLIEASKTYDYTMMHRYCVAQHSWDGNIRPNHCFPLFVRWGSIQNSNSCADRSLSAFKRMVLEPTPDALTYIQCLVEWPSVLYLLGRQSDAAELLRKSAADWANAEQTLTDIASRVAIVGKTEDGAFWSLNDFIWTARALFVLCADLDHCPSAEEFMTELPTPEDLAAQGIISAPDGTKLMHAAHFLGLTSLVWQALALEKLGQADAAMAFASFALEVDHTIGGSNVVWHQFLAHRCRGRLLMAAGQPEQAREAFEAALTSATSRGYWMLEALAVNDLNIHCGGDDGAGARAGSRRLEPMVRRLVGPSEAIEALLEQQPHAVPPVSAATQPSSSPSATTAAKPAISERNLTLLVTSTFFVGTRKVHVTAGSFSQLTSAIQVALGLTKDFSILLYDEDFEEHRSIVDLDEFDTDKAKVQLVDA